MKTTAHDALIDLGDAEAVRARHPLLIAHRGGVIAPDAPENSLAAIRLAAERGYDLVELDAIKPKDDEPVLFHDRAGTLLMNCGVDATLGDLTARELTALRYRGSDQPIATLAEALALCRELRLGVMLDIKAWAGMGVAWGFLRRGRALLDEHTPAAAAITISPQPPVRQELADRVWFPVSADDFRHVRAGGARPLHGQFWFGLPEQLPDAAVPALQRNGALVLPAINTFRYPPHAHTLLAGEDIGRLRSAGVDGFQIDSVYDAFFREE